MLQRILELQIPTLLQYVYEALTHMLAIYQSCKAVLALDSTLVSIRRLLKLKKNDQIRLFTTQYLEMSLHFLQHLTQQVNISWFYDNTQDNICHSASTGPLMSNNYQPGFIDFPQPLLFHSKRVDAQVTKWLRGSFLQSHRACIA